MGRRSSIEQLPADVAALCNRLIRDGRTIAEITEKLNELDAGVSQSAVGRYVKSAREQLKHYKDAQAVAGQWVSELGENPRGDVGALLAEMLKNVAFMTLSNMGEQKGKPTKPMDVMLLAKAIRDLEATSKANIERREKIERAVLERQAAAAEKVAKKQGMSGKQWAQIRAEFLGIKDEAGEPT